VNKVFAQHAPSSVAIIDADDGREVTYEQLLGSVTQTAENLQRGLGRGVVFHLASNTVASIVAYLACLEAGYPVCLLDPGSAARMNPLLAAFQPDALFLPDAMEIPAGFSCSASVPDGTYRFALSRKGGRRSFLHPDLALLLTTSGSTGSPKLVRLTRDNVLANARSIVSYLGIQPGERSIQSLPMHYSFGLSLINSHLLAGATVVLTRHSFMRPEFWEAFDRTKCTSFAGVPYIYETLHRLQFDPRQHPTLHTMTQAGGGLRRDLIQHFHELSTSAGCRFFVMYGQTEATARISYVPFEQLGKKIGSIGIAIPQGRLSLGPAEESDQQELIYSGPNVMMGYAQSADDLAAGDELCATLRTGDLATIDADGYFFLSGRLKRFAKMFGRRISLEDVERDLEARFSIRVAAIDREGQLLVYTAGQHDMDRLGITRYLAQTLSVPPKYITVDTIAEIPMTASGKKDYKTLSS